MSNVLAALELAWGCSGIHLLNAASDELIGADILQTIEQLVGPIIAVAVTVKVGDALDVDGAQPPPRLLAAAPPEPRGHKWLHVDVFAGEQLLPV